MLPYNLIIGSYDKTQHVLIMNLDLVYFTQVWNTGPITMIYFAKTYNWILSLSICSALVNNGNRVDYITTRGANIVFTLKFCIFQYWVKL